MARRAAKPTPLRPTDLKAACITEALAIIEADGPEKLSLRDVARRLGVSHQAPYRHFASRDHLLAEIIGRGFDAFAEHLHACPRTDDAAADLLAMTRAYLDFAALHPLQYRLMFGAVLPDAAAHAPMMGKARHAFTLLTQAVARLGARDEATVLLDSLFVWSSLHGLVAVGQSGAMQKLPLPDAVRDSVARHALARIAAALG